MSWYAEEYLNRWPVCSDGTADTEWSLVIPKNWDHFWDNVSDTTTGYDIVICDGDGETLLTFDLSGFNHSTKTCTLRWNAPLTSVANNEVYWIYWNHSGTAGDLSGAPTVVSLTSALISLVDPLSASDVLDFTVQRPGSTTPIDAVAKSVHDQKMIWVRVPPSITMDRMHASAGTDNLYEVYAVIFLVLIAGSDQSLNTLSSNRVVEDKDGATWVGCFIGGGGWTDATDYTGEVQAALASGTEPTVLIEQQFLIQCNDVSEV